MRRSDATAQLCIPPHCWPKLNQIRDGTSIEILQTSLRGWNRNVTERKIYRDKSQCVGKYLGTGRKRTRGMSGANRKKRPTALYFIKLRIVYKRRAIKRMLTRPVLSNGSLYFVESDDTPSYCSSNVLPKPLPLFTELRNVTLKITRP